jgi:hypothetical protein
MRIVLIQLPLVEQADERIEALVEADLALGNGTCLIHTGTTLQKPWNGLGLTCPVCDLLAAAFAESTVATLPRFRQ